jgi:hypothetical protein
MNLECQVVSIEIAKKLKSLNVKQESLFYWHNIDSIPSVICEHYPPDRSGDFWVSAFTVGELGIMLPKAICIKTEDEEKKIFSNFRLVTGRSLIFEEENAAEFWSVNYICDTTNQFRNFLFDALLSKPIYDKNEANARALMLIYLLESGAIKNG